MRIAYSFYTGKYSLWVQTRLGECEVMKKIADHFDSAKDAWDNMCERLPTGHNAILTEGRRYGILKKPEAASKFFLRKFNVARMDSGPKGMVH